MRPISRTQLQDWNQLGRYHQDDLRLEAAPAVEGRVVFLGDSITDGWDLAKYFPGKPYVNRGISGQTTMQMLVRMHPDVIHLQPGGIHSIGRHQRHRPQHRSGDAGDGGRQHSRHVRAGREPQHQNNPLLAHSRQRLRQGETDGATGRPRILVNLNHWIESYAPDVHAQVADYYTALVDDKGMLREGYSNDGLHPNAQGYELLAPVAEAAIERALK